MENNIYYWRDLFCGAPNDAGGNDKADLKDLRDRYDTDPSTTASTKASTNAAAHAHHSALHHTPANSVVAAREQDRGANSSVGPASRSAAPAPSQVPLTSAVSSSSGGASHPHSREPAKLNLTLAMPHLSLTPEERGTGRHTTASTASIGAADLASIADVALTAPGLAPASPTSASQHAPALPHASSNSEAPPPPATAPPSASAADGEARPAAPSTAGRDSISINKEQLGYFFDK
jgi:hypothetical protein